MAGLRARLATWTALIALATAGLPGLWLTWRAYRALRQESYASQLALARSLASEIDSELSQSIGVVEALAAHPGILGDAGRLNLRVALVASTAERLDDLLVADGDGSLLSRAPHVDDVPPFFPGSERRVVVRQALASKGQTISVVHSERDGRLVLRLARSIGSQAAVMGQLRLESQGIGSLEDLKVGESGFAYLADDQGRPLVLPTLSRRLGGNDAPSLAFRFDGKEFVRDESGPRGHDLLAAAPIESLGWAVAVRRSLDEAEAPARHMRRELYLFTALAVALGLTLPFFLARRLVTNLLILASEARRIESGRMDARGLEGLQASDEVGEVAGALSHMARALAAQQAERERAHARALAAEKRLARNERLAALGQLAAGLAHELNNPLMVIHGAAGEAAALAPKAARAWLDRVQRESDRCSRLVRELLDYARPRPPRWRPFDLASLCRETFEAARIRREAAYQLRLEIPVRSVRGDRDQFHQVLLNLFSNAMDAMPEGGEIQASLSGDRRAGWRLAVRDRGTGVPPRSREAVFRPFFTSKAKGTGLGLAIARSLMQGHGGSLRCLPMRGKGACFEAVWSQHTRTSHA